MPLLIDVGGFHVGPLFEMRIKWPLVRPKGKEGVVHRAQRRRRTPPWADMQVISAFYQEARRLTKMTGESYEVDHIVPLVGKIVSGLHVPWNLRVVHWRVNNRKGAWSWPDMPMEQQEFTF